MRVDLFQEELIDCPVVCRVGLLIGIYKRSKVSLPSPAVTNACILLLSALAAASAISPCDGDDSPALPAAKATVAPLVSDAALSGRPSDSFFKIYEEF